METEGLRLKEPGSAARYSMAAHCRQSVPPEPSALTHPFRGANNTKRVKVEYVEEGATELR